MIVGSADAKGRCLVCSTPSCVCGPDSSHVTAVDQHEPAPTKETNVALKTYDVEINGVKTQMKLNEEDAKRYGATETKKTASASNKKKTTKDEG